MSPSRSPRSGDRTGARLQRRPRRIDARGGVHFREHDIRASTATLDSANAKKRFGHKKRSTTDICLRQLEQERIAPLEVALTLKKKEA